MADWRGQSTPGGRALLIGAVLTALWVVMLAVFWLTSDGGAPGWIQLVAALMPLGLIWMAVGLARAIDALKAEAASLRALLDQGGAPLPPLPARPTPDAGSLTARPPTPSRPTPRATPARRPAESAPGPEDPRQSSLGFDQPPPVELPPMTVIRALNFPDGPEDREAIQALRETLRDPDHARLIRSAQDVITLLAERGVFTDELEASPASVASWRRFAEGQRGQAVGAMGAIRDPAMLEAATAAIRGDEVFRDAVHHFLRLFDRSVTAMMPELDDDQIVWLSETRSARAFMLLARAAGLFGQDE